MFLLKGVYGKTTYDWHTDDIPVYTNDIQMTYEHIRVTHGWHTSTYEWHKSICEWHTDDIRVHTCDIRMTWVHTNNIRMTWVHTSDIQITYEHIRVTCVWHTSTYCFGLFTIIKKGSGISFWFTFSAWVFHTNAPYLILYQLTKFQCHIYLQDIK